jgi:hypothetical protein
LKARHARHQPFDGEGMRGRDAQDGFLVAALQGRDLGAQVAQRAPHRDRQLLAFRGQRDMARMAHEQRKAQRLFQLLDLQADGGRGLVQLLARQLETAPAGGAFEVDQAGQAAQGFHRAIMHKFFLFIAMFFSCLNNCCTAYKI